MASRYEFAETEHGHYMRAWRKRSGLSQQKVADIMVRAGRPPRQSMSKSTISRIENGLLPYSEYILGGFALAVGCTPAQLLNGPPPMASEQILDALQIWLAEGDPAAPVKSPPRARSSARRKSRKPRG